MGERTPETVTTEIEREREQLALAVSQLRSELRAVTDVRAMLREKAPQLTIGAAVAAGAFVLTRFVRHRRNPAEVARFGRFSLVER